MIISKKCLNCGHIASQDASVESCPACSAIYSKVEAALTQPGDLPNPYAASLKKLAQQAPQTGKFIEVLRAESNYPNFRGLVKLATWFFYLVAIAIALSAIFSSDVTGSMRMGALLGAVVLAVFVTAAKEATLMLADLSDAAVYSAQRSGQHG